MTKYLKKGRDKQWAEPLGDAMSVTASIADGLRALGVPFAGVIGGAAKIGSAVQNPRPSLTDLIRAHQSIKAKIQNTASEMAQEMKSIQENLELTKKIVHETYNMVADTRYKDGLEIIDSAYVVFMNGAKKPRSNLYRDGVYF